MDRHPSIKLDELLSYLVLHAHLEIRMHRWLSDATAISLSTELNYMLQKTRWVR